MSAPESSSEEDELTPITVVTGFLGAGKTTLVNYILKEQNEWKIAVLENEFGEVSIDDGLVAESMDAPEDLITMDNGCVCCSVRGDLIRTLGQLTAQRKKFDSILLETTGLADPAPIIYTIQTNPKISQHYKIDSIVCLADAKHIIQHLDEVKPDNAVNEAQQQVAFADKILLNKVDLVSEEEKQNVLGRLNLLNKFASVIETTKSRAPLEKIMGINSFNMDSILTIDPEFLNEEEQDNKKEHRTDLVQSVGLQFEGNLHAQWFNMFMMDLLKERAADLYRTKGLLSFQGQGDTKFVFQGVHEQINFGPSKEPWKEGEVRMNKFVFIGKNLDRKELTKSLMECLFKEEE